MEKINFNVIRLHNEARRLALRESGKEKKSQRFEKKRTEINARLQKIQKKEEEKRFLFWYTVFTFIENKVYVTLTEIEAENKLTQYSSKEMEVYYCKFPETQTPMPGILKGRKGLITESVTSHKEVSELIYEKTGGVSVPESDLRVKQKDSRSLGVRAMAFVKQANEAEAKEKRVQEIYQCLLENDKKRRLECLKNCKI